MEDREAVHQPVIGCHPPGPGDRADSGQQIPVAEHRPLRRPGRARGEADQGRVVGTGSIERTRIGVRQVEVGAGDHHRTGGGLAYPVGLCGSVDHRRPRPDVGDDVGQFAGRVGGVGRDDHQPGPQRPDVGHQGVDRRIGRPQHPVARLQARAAQPARGPPGGLVELPRRPPPARPRATTGAEGSSDHRRPRVTQERPGPDQVRRPRSVTRHQGVVRFQVITPGAHGGLLVGVRDGTVPGAAPGPVHAS